MGLIKDVKWSGMPWEAEYGYAQAVQVDDTIYVSGQLSHDDQGNTIIETPRLALPTQLIEIKFIAKIG